MSKLDHLNGDFSSENCVKNLLRIYSAHKGYT